MTAPRVDPSYLSGLQANTSHIRNMCILAHVDHGKTTLSDSLVGSNGLFSQKLVGKLRYLDSTEEEQQRGITTKSSAISLLYRPEDKTASANTSTTNATESVSSSAEDYLINLVDSPGHIDFSSEVSTASRVCDGALLIVDAIEGVCTQTRAVVFKALRERMTPCLVLNKLDRLAMELQLTPIEAFHHLRRVIENVNALAYGLVLSEIRAQDSSKTVNAGSKIDTQDSRVLQEPTPGANEPETAVGQSKNEDDNPLFQQWSFAPEKGNIIFASAIDCWGFATPRFAKMWAAKLAESAVAAASAAATPENPNPAPANTISAKVLTRYMFENVYYNARANKILKCDSAADASGTSTPPPLFASLVLEPLWTLYRTALGSGTSADDSSSGESSGDVTKAAKMARRALGVTLSEREVNARDPRGTLRTILSRWLPLSEAVLRMVVRCMPDPAAAQRHRLAYLMAAQPPLPAEGCSPLLHAVHMRVSTVRAAIENCSLAGKDDAKDSTSDGEVITVAASAAQADTVIFITKMMSVRLADLSDLDRASVIEQRRASLAAGGVGGGGVLSNTDEAENADVFIALARVFSGTLSRGDSRPLYVLSTRYNPYELPIGTESSASETNIERALSVNDGDVPPGMEGVSRIDTSNLSLYLCLGPAFAPIQTAYAGNIVGILGLEKYVLKTATLSTTWACQPLRAMTFQAQPMLRVALEPQSHTDLNKLEIGLKLLHQFDAVVEIGVDERGQHTMTCLGELHLEHCLKVLIERFARCPIVASEPLVSMCETVLPFSTTTPPSMQEYSCGAGSNAGGAASTTSAQRTLPPPWCDMTGVASSVDGVYVLDTHQHDKAPNAQRLTVQVRCLPLPAAAMRALVDEATQAPTEHGTELLKHIHKTQLQRHGGVSEYGSAAEENETERIALIWNSFSSTLVDSAANPSVSLYTGNAEAAGDLLGPTVASVFLGVEQQKDEGKSRAGKGKSGKGASDRDKPNVPGETTLGDSMTSHLGALSRLLAMGPSAPTQSLSSGSSVSSGGAHGSRSNTNVLVLADSARMRLWYDMVPASGSPSGLSQAVNADYVNGNGSGYSTVTAKHHAHIFQALFRRLNTIFVTAFQVACTAGPLMKEPLTGLCFIIEDIQMSLTAALHSTDTKLEKLAQSLQDDVLLRMAAAAAPQAPSADTTNSVGSVLITPSHHTLFSGSLISQITEALHLAMLSSPLRVVEPIYTFTLQCDQSQLGSVYSVLSRRRGYVVGEDIIDGTSLFILTAHLPVLESFGFAQELLHNSKGEATAPQFQFSHWAVRCKDPFWRPTTADEREDYGEASTLAGVTHANPVRVLIDKTRKRKGLQIEEKIVAFAEKQRTVSKKK